MLRDMVKTERATGGAGSRRIFAPHFKLQVLDSYRNDADCKGNQRATARKYGIHRRQIQKWLQAEGALRNSVGAGKAPRRVDASVAPAAPVAEPPAPSPSPSPPAPIDLSLKRRATSPPAAWDLRVKRPAKLFKPYLDEEEEEKRFGAPPQLPPPPPCCCPCCEFNNNEAEYYTPRPLYYYPPTYYHHPEYSLDLKLVDCYYQEAACRRPEADTVRQAHAVR